MVQDGRPARRGKSRIETRRIRLRRPSVLPLDILPQPNDETCGPTCLHAVYQYWGDDISLDEVIRSASSLNSHEAGRGTLAVMLGTHALKRGYKASLYTFNLQMFDPTWFDEHGKCDSAKLSHKLQMQGLAKQTGNPRFRIATECYLEFLRLGGDVRFRDLTSSLITGFIRAGKPLLTGVSSTYLYKCMREFGPKDDDDDIRGEPTGHFVVIHGYESKGRVVSVADPLANNPGFQRQRYTVTMSQLVPAIMLGVLTYDANLLVIEPKKSEASGERTR
ncbi:MAG: C39 family peptidase [Phycisphaeraceae bacterium]|nr:C39 family peptidase [Phycisphaerales bacterium]MCB9861697.1 C39 family peptidase [Phycisphaeraceae bacterium]